jgi:hypothetical protein
MVLLKSIHKPQIKSLDKQNTNVYNMHYQKRRTEEVVVNYPYRKQPADERRKVTHHEYIRELRTEKI